MLRHQQIVAVKNVAKYLKLLARQLILKAYVITGVNSNEAR